MQQYDDFLIHAPIISCMSTMTIEVYEALKAAGAPEDKAIQAAEAVASSQSATKSDILMLEKQIMLVQSEQKLMKWMLGIVLVAVVIPLIKNLLL